jgi:hypothetical protein
MNLFEKSIKELRTVCNRLDKCGALGQEYSKELWQVLYKMEDEYWARQKAKEEEKA